MKAAGKDREGQLGARGTEKKAPTIFAGLWGPKDTTVRLLPHWGLPLCQFLSISSRKNIGKGTPVAFRANLLIRLPGVPWLHYRECSPGLLYVFRGHFC
jgi:hypothetical protein